jgi:nucleoside-diphosphate-sugar epimerase
VFLQVLTTYQIRDRVDVVIHNAWSLDFNLALSAFEPHVQATRRLLDLVFDSRRASKARLLFTSSIAAVQGWDKTKGSCPEESFDDPNVAVGTGYGASKYVAEQVSSGISKLAVYHV